jgi:hypothetical protein
MSHGQIRTSTVEEIVLLRRMTSTGRVESLAAATAFLSATDSSRPFV